MTRDALIRIADLLPANWGIDQVAGSQDEGGRIGGVVDLTSSTGDRASFVVETARSGSVPTLLLLARLRETRSQMGLPVLFMSDYIGPSLRTALVDASFSYADATGWIRIVSEDPLGPAHWSRGITIPTGSAGQCSLAAQRSCSQPRNPSPRGRRPAGGCSESGGGSGRVAGVGLEVACHAGVGGNR